MAWDTKMTEMTLPLVIYFATLLSRSPEVEHENEMFDRIRHKYRPFQLRRVQRIPKADDRDIL